MQFGSSELQEWVVDERGRVTSSCTCLRGRNQDLGHGMLSDIRELTMEAHMRYRRMSIHTVAPRKL